jgi:hypothetical protein
VRTQKLEMLDHGMRLVAAKLAGQAKKHRARLRAARLKLDLALAGIGLDAVQLFEEVDVPRHAAVFAVADRLQPGRFLLRDHAGDFAVFGRLERFGVDFVARAPLAGRFERRRAQETADMVGAKRWGVALGHIYS